MIYNRKELIRGIRFTGDNRNNAVIPLSGCLGYFTEKVFIFRIFIFMSDCLGYFYIIIFFILLPYLY